MLMQIGFLLKQVSSCSTLYFREVSWRLSVIFDQCRTALQHKLLEPVSEIHKDAFISVGGDCVSLWLCSSLQLSSSMA
jgi:hypothetical protein